MNADVELGVKAYLQPRLAPVLVLCGTSDADVPNAVQNVIVVVKLPHAAGNLYTGELKVIVSTPANKEDITLADHRALVRKVKQEMFWDLDDPQAIAKADEMETAMMANGRWGYRGFFLKLPTDAQNEDMWQTVFDATLGVEGPYPEPEPEPDGEDW